MKRKALLLIICAFAVWPASCHKKAARPVITPPAVQPVPVSPPAVPIPATWPELPLPPSRLPAPPEPPLPKNFRDGETAFLSGRYADAIRFYEKYVKEDPVTQYKDVAIFRLGISNALVCGAAADCRTKSLEKSQEQFKRLVSQFPKSPYSAEARFILGLQGDIEKLSLEAKVREEKIKKLTEELEQLKKIDLERRIKK